MRILFCAMLAFAGCVSGLNNNPSPDAQASDAMVEVDASVPRIWFAGLSDGATFDENDNPHLSVQVVGFAHQVVIFDNGQQIGLAVQSQTEAGLFGFEWQGRHSVGEHHLQAKAVRPGTEMLDESPVVRVVVTTPPTPTPPVVWFDSPTAMQSVEQGTDVEVIVKATDNSSVESFEIWVGSVDSGSIVATAEGDHWTAKFQWTATVAGAYMASVKARDNEGWAGTAELHFQVAAPP